MSKPRRVFETERNAYGVHCAVFRLPDFDEYVLRTYVDGRHVPSADYFTSDRKDAIATATYTVNGSAQAAAYLRDKAKESRAMMVYLDSLSGLIPCKAIARRTHCSYGPEILVRVTADRPGWKRGKESWWPRRRVVPRSAVYKPRGAYMLRVRAYDPAVTFAALPDDMSARLG